MNIGPADIPGVDEGWERCTILQGVKSWQRRQGGAAEVVWRRCCQTTVLCSSVRMLLLMLCVSPA